MSTRVTANTKEPPLVSERGRDLFVPFANCLFALGLLILATLSSAPGAEPGAPATAAEKLLQPGPEMSILQHRIGEWEVTATFRSAPDVEAQVTKGIVAHREMVGPYMLEVMRPASGGKVPDFRRDAYITYNRVEGRWQYVSIDTRFPVGIMPAYGFGKGEKDDPLTLVFEPIAFVGVGPTVEGRMVRSNLVITRKSDDHELVQQYFISSDGTERQWLATEYEYTRKKP